MVFIYNDSNIKSKSAYRRIRKYIRNTPLEKSKKLSQQMFGHIYFKMENWQFTG